MCAGKCTDFAPLILWGFINIENRLKTKKTCKSLNLQVFRHFLRLFEKIEKFKFSGFSAFPWGEQDSNLRSSHSRFTVCPRWPLEYLPDLSLLCFVVLSGGKDSNVFYISKQKKDLILSYFKVIF